MAMPKKRMTSTRTGNRRSHLALDAINLRPCPNCKVPTIPHRVCRECGYYRKRQVSEKKTA